MSVALKSKIKDMKKDLEYNIYHLKYLTMKMKDWKCSYEYFIKNAFKYKNIIKKMNSEIEEMEFELFDKYKENTTYRRKDITGVIGCLDSIDELYDKLKNTPYDDLDKLISLDFFLNFESVLDELIKINN